MRMRHSYELEVNNDRSETVRYSYTDIPIGFFADIFLRIRTVLSQHTGMRTSN